MMQVHSRRATLSMFLMHKKMMIQNYSLVANTMGFYFVTYNITKGHSEWKHHLHVLLDMMKNKKDY